jgi:hypothetical protein
MKRSFGLIVAFLGLLAVIAVLYGRLSTNYKQLQAEDSLVRVQRDYLERIAWIRSNPDDRTYREEVNTFLRWYFKQVDAHVDRYAGNKNFDTYMVELEKRAEKGSKDGQLGEKKAAYELTKNIFDQMRSGKYSPLWTATDKGMRLDVLTSDVKMVGGSPKVRMDVVLWGAQREAREDAVGAPVPTPRPPNFKRMATSASYDVQWKLVDAGGNMLGKMSAGDPSMKIDYPERFIAEFPPQVVLGYYELDLFPAEVAKIETVFTISSRAPSGGEAVAKLTWNLDTPAEWRLRAGEKWEGATEQTATPEEINPAKAAEAATKKGRNR